MIIFTLKKLQKGGDFDNHVCTYLCFHEIAWMMMTVDIILTLGSVTSLSEQDFEVILNAVSMNIFLRLFLMSE